VSVPAVSVTDARPISSCSVKRRFARLGLGADQQRKHVVLRVRPRLGDQLAHVLIEDDHPLAEREHLLAFGGLDHQVDRVAHPLAQARRVVDRGPEHLGGDQHRDHLGVPGDDVGLAVGDEAVDRLLGEAVHRRFCAPARRSA